ncbi:hypothetical protein Leucomu_12980 [Leucobacter muris]|uniref:DNA-binding protein n=1 Tax=Leucobacter muris TaxID=1935379 RepID=A0ABX5QI43_9MICO|nr:hypothetical protein [Leucobacter muris]QAB18700.1 hypothetical protein Leucomu_12980 [Leucobacter muris]
MSAEVVPLRAGSKAQASAPVWLSPADVCEQIPGMTEEILAERRKKNLKPRFFKPSLKTVIYEQSDITEWIRSTASEPRA